MMQTYLECASAGVSDAEEVVESCFGEGGS